MNKSQWAEEVLSSHYEQSQTLAYEVRSGILSDTEITLDEGLLSDMPDDCAPELALRGLRLIGGIRGDNVTIYIDRVKIDSFRSISVT